MRKIVINKEVMRKLPYTIFREKMSTSIKIKTVRTQPEI